MKTFKEMRKSLNELNGQTGPVLREGVFSVKLDKPYKRGDEKMYMNIIKKYGGKNLKFSPPKGRDLELDIYFDGGDIKKIKSNLPNKGKGSEWISEKYRSRFPSSLVAAAVKIAIDMGGNMTGAYKKIEKMKRGLGDDPMVADALKQANESVKETFKKT